MNCTTWPARRPRAAEPAAARGRLVALALGFAAAACAAAAHAQAAPSGPAPDHYAFAVIANVMTQQADETAASTLVDALSRDPQLAFVVYDGNLKGAHEACADTLYARREALLDAARVPVVFVPGQQDWASCGAGSAYTYDPVERLDQLRQTFFADSMSLGQNPLRLTRESEIPRFRPYRENVRWQYGDTVYVALNAPGGNNHYLYAGGRNGEFEDRVIANTFWLEHAAEYAKRRNARALVVFVEADPFAEHAERAGGFGWLRFARRPRDGYLELRASLVKLAGTFRGPVVVVHDATANHVLTRGFLIDQPLRNDKGVTVQNLTRIEVGLRTPLAQWLRVDVDSARRPLLRVSVRDVPKNLPPLPPAAPPSAPEMPEIASMPEVTTVPDMASAPDEQPASAPDGAASGTSSGTNGTDVAGGTPARAAPSGGGAETATPPAMPAASGTASVQRGF